MTKPLPRQLLVLGLLWAASASPWAQVPARTVQHEAQGSFEVQMTPQGSGDEVDGVRLGRMALSKTFRGALVGSGQGEMLTALTPFKGSAGYVALERVTGVLDGRKGSFVLQHSGSMQAGAQSLSIGIVPGSGTGELQGIEGALQIRIVDGEHLYTLAYTLPL